VATEIAKRLRADCYRVVRSRTSDSSVRSFPADELTSGTLDPTQVRHDLQARVRCANDSHASALVSIHFNGYTDPKGHKSGTLVDGLGRTAYEQRYTGNSGSTYALYATARYSYNFVGNLVKIVQPDGVTQTTFGYDMAGRKTSMTDPDLGGQTYGRQAWAEIYNGKITNGGVNDVPRP
jgi:YD repeat-containing protein